MGQKVVQSQLAVTIVQQNIVSKVVRVEFISVDWTFAVFVLPLWWFQFVINCFLDCSHVEVNDPFLCLDLCYISALLHEGFGFNHSSTLLVHCSFVWTISPVHCDIAELNYSIMNIIISYFNRNCQQHHTACDLVKILCKVLYLAQESLDCSIVSR